MAGMKWQKHPDSLAFKMLVLFASAPELEMTAADIRKKFGEHRCVSGSLRYGVKNGYFTRRGVRGISDRIVYSAGPLIMRELGFEVGEKS